MRARAKAYTALQDLLVTAPAALREQLTGRYKGRLLQACQQLIASEIPTSPTDAMILTIKSLATRCLHLDAEAAELERHIDAITATAAPQLRAVYGVGPDTAATLISAIGDNHDRISSDAAFAKLCGVCPLEASSGKTIRHRLNRGGNRDANRALHVILVVRMRRHQPTRDYIARHLAEGKTKTRSCDASSATSPAKSSTRYTRPADQPLKSLLEHSICYQAGAREDEVGLDAAQRLLDEDVQFDADQVAGYGVDDAVRGRGAPPDCIRRYGRSSTSVGRSQSDPPSWC